MPNFKKVLTLSFAALLAQFILTKGLYPLLNLSTQTVFSINPVSGVGGTQIGDSILGYLSGYIPFNLSNFSVWIAMFIGAFSLVYAGFWLYEQKYVKLWKGKNITQRLIAILLYGHVLLFAVLWLLKMSVPAIAFNLLIGLAINYAIVAIVVSGLATKVKFFRFLRI